MNKLTSFIKYTALTTLLLITASVSSADTPTRALDLGYGVALYNYHQGNYFEALTDLAVAFEKGGISNHGDHPSLVEGGLMLSYGMTREAKQRFEQVALDNVSPQSRNEAWYYLTKVFFLEGDVPAATETAAKVNLELLEEKSSGLKDEFIYIQAQLKLRQGDSAGARVLMSQLSESSVWRYYIQYNQAILDLEQNPEAATKALGEINLPIVAIEPDETLSSNQQELVSLKDQIQLTKAELELRTGNAEAAMASFRAVRLEGPFSDQALFGLAIAAATNQDFGLALEALKTIDGRELFNPWIQQTPYALGFLYEQLAEPEIALRAYETASLHYLNLQTQLQSTIDNLSEASILQTLKLDTSGGEVVLRDETDAALSLGNEQLVNDSYGRLKVAPQDFGLSSLLSRESFQIALRDLHELYHLKNSLVRWERQLASFETMIDTRETQRERKIAETLAALEEQNANSWVRRYEDYKQRVEQALAKEDPVFFASEDQLEFQLVIDAIYDNIATLPEGPDKTEFKQKADRMKGYFTWLLYDDYGVNRWAVEKQLRELGTAIEEFKNRNEGLRNEIASGSENAEMANRVNSGKARLRQLGVSLDQQLLATREKLVELVRSDLEEQHAQTLGYLVASREARARISDDLFRAQNAPDEPAENVEKDGSASEEPSAGDEPSALGQEPLAQAQEPSAQGQEPSADEETSAPEDAAAESQGELQEATP